MLPLAGGSTTAGAGVGLVMMLLVHGTAHAADFVAVNTLPSPDTLVRFNSDDPAGVDVMNPIAELAGDFVRGIEMESADAGWYVATDSTRGGVGFYRLENGVSTLVGPLPFNSSSIGGLSYTRNQDALFWVSDPPDERDDTLFRIDFDGTITEINEITLIGAPIISISAIAVDPADGTLYAIDTTTDALLTIDTTTGVAASVGSLGVPVNAVGGADFAPNGLLIVAITFGAVYEVDTTTGAASPSTGDLGFNPGSIASVPSACPADISSAGSSGPDGEINLFDLLALLSGWNTDGAGAQLAEPNNVVNLFDLLALLAEWGPC